MKINIVSNNVSNSMTTDDSSKVIPGIIYERVQKSVTFQPLNNFLGYDGYLVSSAK